MLVNDIPAEAVSWQYTLVGRMGSLLIAEDLVLLFQALAFENVLELLVSVLHGTTTSVLRDCIA